MDANRMGILQLRARSSWISVYQRSLVVPFFFWILAVALLTVGINASTAVAAPPNVLMIVSDDQAWTDYGFMGNSRIQTPHLDRLASESAVFTRGYVPMSLCRPSLATMVTGLFPHQHGTPGNDPRVEKREGVPTLKNPDYLRLNRLCIDRFAHRQSLSRLLTAAGYATLQTGKWWEGSYQDGGFTVGMTHGDPARGGRHGDAGLAIGREGL